MYCFFENDSYYNAMLELSHISVSVAEKQIITDISFAFDSAKIYAILGKNGSGKSSLAFALFHHPRYQLTGTVSLDGLDISDALPNELSEQGMFLSFQNIPEIPGIRLCEYLRTIYVHHFKLRHPGQKIPTPFIFRRMIEKMLPNYGLPASFLDRDLYVGFSGGEKRRIEMLQVELLDPRCIVLDEIDSGLDITAIELLAKYIDTWRNKGKTCIIISHNFHLLDSINVDEVVLMGSWQIVRHGGQELIQSVREQGF